MAILEASTDGHGLLGDDGHPYRERFHTVIPSRRVVRSHRARATPSPPAVGDARGKHRADARELEASRIELNQAVHVACRSFVLDHLIVDGGDVGGPVAQFAIEVDRRSQLTGNDLARIRALVAELVAGAGLPEPMAAPR